jgi:hypothetical protein
MSEPKQDVHDTVEAQGNDDADLGAGARVGPKALTGSRDALRAAATILETLGGLRSTQEASEIPGVALARYYVLETRALQGMVEALEPRPRGRRPDPGLELERLRSEVSRLERDVLRYQALNRASQRALGLPREEVEPVASKSKKKATRTRRVRRKSRGERVVDGIGKRNRGKSPPLQQAEADVGHGTTREVT